MVDCIETMTVTTTDAKGLPTVFMTTTSRKVAAPLAVVKPSPEALTTSDKITLAVGIGIGIPTILLTVVGLCLQYRKRREVGDIHYIFAKNVALNIVVRN